MRIVQPSDSGVARARLDAAGEGIYRVVVAVHDLKKTAALFTERGIVNAGSDDFIDVAGGEIMNAAMRFVQDDAQEAH